MPPDISGTPTIPSAVGGANGVDFNDDVKARFGTGNDFEIYHDSSSDVTFLNESGSGNLQQEVEALFSNHKLIMMITLSV